jgi:hypothetical protein
MLRLCKSLRHQAQTPFVRDAQISRNADEPNGHVLIGRRRHCPRSPTVPESAGRASSGLVSHFDEAEFGIYITANRTFIPNYGDRYRHGETISTAFVKSAVNQVVSKRMVKKQQMRWTDRGAHLLLQVRTRVLNEEWRSTLSHWYPAMRRHAMRRRPSPRFFPVSFPRSVRFSREWIWRFTDQSCLTSLSANANYPNLTTISQSANRQHLNS